MNNLLKTARKETITCVPAIFSCKMCTELLPPQLSRKWQISNSKCLLLLIYCKSDMSITFSAHVCSWQPDIGKTFFFIQLHEDFRAHGFWVAVAAPGILNNVRFSLEVHHSCNTQLMLQLDGHVLHLPRATSQPDVWQNPSIEKTLGLITVS